MTLQSCPQKKMGLPGENSFKCIKTHLKMHQNVSALELPPGSLTATSSQFLESLLGSSIVNVQMQDLGESQAKSRQISARGGRDLAGLHPPERINWEWAYGDCLLNRIFTLIINSR